MTDEMNKKMSELCPGYASIRRLLLKLNYDYLALIDRWESRIGETVPLADLFGGNPTLTLEDVAEAAYFEMVKTAKELYFSRLSRDEALIIANSLASGTLKLAEDLEFNGCTFAAAWSDVHPDEEKIRRNTGFAI
nr:MAG TPA: hypothetical protein [Caudoviricetes sp.]